MPLNKEIIWVVILLTFNTTLFGLTKKDDLRLLFQKNKSIEQHAAHIYAEKPHLQHYFYQLPEQTTEISLQETLQKYSQYFSKYGIDLAMLLYCTYAIYSKHSELYYENVDVTKQSSLKNKILEYIPKHIMNAPKHTCFFLDSVEIIVKAFIVKTIIKLLIFFVQFG